MRIILCLLALVAAPAWAEWVKMDETDTGTYYIDPSTIRKNGQFRKVWQVQDLKQRARGGEMSQRVLWEFDCREKRFRFLSYSTHFEPKATGKTLVSEGDTDDWDSVPPDSAAEAILKFVCAK
ncbi:MAG: hypothetical protein FIA96_11120 [Betaproteobacteria bacterium]|nr:hypothetical protein [Betaproteobacteria bacterium]